MMRSWWRRKLPEGQSYEEGNTSNKSNTGNASNAEMESGYKKLIVWQEAIRLVVLVYNLTKTFPKSEDYALRDQMRRAVVSVLSQIAEGWLRRSKKDKLHYLEISQGSLMELETQAEVAKAVEYWDHVTFQKFDKQRAVVCYLLIRYISKIRSS